MKRLIAALLFVIASSPALALPVATQWEWPLRGYSTDFWEVYYDASPNFPHYNTNLKKYHLGADLNITPNVNATPPEDGGVDCGEGVYAVATGKVVFVGYGGTGWGNVVVIKHNLGGGRYVSSLYGHLRVINTTWAYLDSEVEPDVLIGEIGSADRTDGQCTNDDDYQPHLHFEIRQMSARSTVKATCPKAGTTFTPTERFQCVGSGYVASLADPLLEEYTDPIKFIEQMNADEEDQVPDGVSTPVPSNNATVSGLGNCTNAQSETVPCLKWSAALKATLYEVYLDGRRIGVTLQNQFILESGLTKGTHTWFIKARNFFSEWLSSVWTFTLSGTPAGTVTAPILAKATPQSLAVATVQLAGEVNPSGSLTEYWFEWGLTQNYGNTTSVLTAGTGDTFLPFTATVWGLACNTTYHYRMNARNDQGETLGDDVAFQTAACSVDPPSVTTTAADVEIVGSIKFWGTFNPHGNSTRYWFEWGTETGVYPNSTNALNLGAGTSNTSQSFTKVVGCDPEVIYYRAVAQNDGGRTYGSEVSKTMPSCMVEAPANLTATDNGNGTVTLNWTDNSDNETNFIVSWLPEGGTSYYQRHATDPNATGWTDTFSFTSQFPDWPDEWDDGEYCYKVTAYSYNVPYNTSAPSNTACFTKPMQESGSGNTHSAALDRASQQYFSISDSSQSGLDITGNMTVEAWVNIDYEPSGNWNAMVASKDDGTSGTRSWLFYYSYVNGTYRLYFVSGSNGTNMTAGGLVYTLSTDTWHHLAAVYTASSGRVDFYVDGQSAGYATGLPTSIANGSGAFRIGDGGGGGNNLPGLIDEVRVWSVARSAAQIDANYDTEVSCTETGLAGYWHFNNDATDCTSNGNNLTPTNSPTYSSSVPF